MVGVDVIGCDESDQGWSCISHSVYGQHVHMGDIIIFRPSFLLTQTAHPPHCEGFYGPARSIYMLHYLLASPSPSTFWRIPLQVRCHCRRCQGFLEHAEALPINEKQTTFVLQTDEWRSSLPDIPRYFFFYACSGCTLITKFNARKCPLYRSLQVESHACFTHKHTPFPKEQGRSQPHRRLSASELPNLCTARECAS
uniref:AlNc14C19G1948 protein n=1 Tax=Albugo laibachii Nc14 TaxID=890382 RepID=F0W4X7_9STRA|nr:AlNc14C19G1948 [Albugo laibachii Nc14]|eukprot:CCA16167.1 AlNc14C19G1948 [Albugo laibachii Nc14]